MDGPFRSQTSMAMALEGLFLMSSSLFTPSTIGNSVHLPPEINVSMISLYQGHKRVLHHA